jgi:hypothetical protein
MGLVGLPDAASMEALAMQFVASLRREDYYKGVQLKPVSANRADPNDPSFDAERAVAFHMQRGDVDEAGWLIFLMTHFAGGIWSWGKVIGDPGAFYRWLNANWQDVGGAFGNHRKYESMRPTSSRPMARTVADYLVWIGPGGHRAFFADTVRSAGNDPHVIFDHLYRTLEVRSFGRLAKFDYLALVGRYALAPISAGSAYLDGATGPGRGVRLLFDGDPTSATRNSVLQSKLDTLDARLGVGMEVMEDALCNWQKSSRQFVHYTG